MPDLSFRVEKAEPAKFTASPQINFSLAVDDADLQPVHAIALRCQIRIEPARRAYDAEEKQRLRDLFGEPSRWGLTMRTMLWAHTTAIVPPFNGRTIVQLPVPCTYDFNIAAAKYFHGLHDGEVPLCFLFSGTVFFPSEEGNLQISQIPWEKEAGFRLPVGIWRDMMDLHYPNTAWVPLRRDAFDGLYEFRSRNALPTWEGAIEKLLAAQLDLDQVST
jgi:hypothetical protein